MDSNVGGFARYRATLLFCDIRGFTGFFDQCPPDETYLFVTSVLKRMTYLVEANGGAISNFTGDGFFAQFGSQERSIDGASGGSPEADAVRCALQIRKELEVLNSERHAGHVFTFSLGIGIHTGPVAAGEIEIAGRRQSIVLGDTVNTASRIESLCKFFSVDILISESTAEPVRDQFKLMPMAAKELRGKVGKHRTFWVMPTSTAMTDGE